MKERILRVAGGVVVGMLLRCAAEDLWNHSVPGAASYFCAAAIVAGFVVFVEEP